MPNLVGTSLNQVPTNSMLGGMAYQDPNHVSIKDLDLKNLSQINSEIADTAVDVFVYDTRKDSDGGAWRKRTQNTSWYNETLGTATRGTRKEFPTVAVIVVETTRVIIYDGDDPDLPMWMVFESNSYGNMLGEATNACVAMFNAKISLGCSPHDLYVADFIQDGGVSYSTSSSISGTYYGNILQRNIFATPGSPANSWIFGTVPNIRNRTIYDLAMTALPNAPVDPSTGLPIPTIALGTADGISVIRDDGRVVDYTNTASSHDVAGSLDINDSNEILYTFDSNTSSRRVYLTPILNKDTTTLLSTSHPIESTGTLGYGAKVDVGNYNGFLIGRSINHITKTGGRTFATGDEGGTEQNGLSLIDPQTSTTAGSKESLIAHISSTYNTGWMHGDIRGAFLSDTDVTNAGAAQEKVTNGDFNSNIDSWTDHFNNLTLTRDTSVFGSGGIKVQTGGGQAMARQTITGLVSGKRYVFSADAYTPSTNSGTDVATINIVSAGYTSTTAASTTSTNTIQNISITFTASGTTQSINLSVVAADYATFGVSGNVGYFDNVSVTPAEEDRSVIGNPLRVYGTVTKTPVATGADLVAYGPFSSNNYIKQTYNSNLNYGTGDYYFIYWLNSPTINSDQSVFCQGDYAAGRGMFTLAHNSSGTGDQLLVGDGNGSVIIQEHENKGWVQICLVRSNGNLFGYRNGVLQGTTTSTLDINNVNTSVVFGAMFNNGSIGFAYSGKLALFRTGASAPSPEQVKKAYEDEKCLFQENAKCTLYGSSDQVTGLAYDDTTSLLHVGTSSGRSTFSGLKRVENTTTPVTTAISASNGLVAEQ